MTISERLGYVIDYLKISPNAFAAKISVSQPRMRNYLNGRDPDYDTLKRICETFVIINPRWLLTGIGSMLEQTEEHPIEKTGREEDLMQIIKTQAQTLLEQQRFIQENCGKGLPTPPLTGAQFADNEHNKRTL